jgi:excisionase family DNA binding protein
VISQGKFGIVLLPRAAYGDIAWENGPKTDRTARLSMHEVAHVSKLIGVKEAAHYVGLSAHTVYTMVSQRRIPYVKVGRLVKFDSAQLDAWILKNTVMPVTRVSAA